MVNITHQKSRKISAYYLFVFYVIVFMFAFLIIPKTASAACGNISDKSIRFLCFDNHVESVQNTLASTQSAGVQQIWKNILDLLNSLVIGVLIFIAFAQILRLNINTYGIKKVLPSLIFAVIAANFSYLLVRILVDVSNVIAQHFIGNASGTDLLGATGIKDEKGGFGVWSPPNITAGDSYGYIFKNLIYAILLFVAAGMIYVLTFLLFIRNWIIYFLTALSPLAFMAMALPQAKSVFNQWWSNLIKWIFMPIVSLFWLWLGNQWFNASFANKGGNGTFMSFIFAMVCIYLAMTTPFKMGGAIMSQWGGLGKKAWGATLGGGTVGHFTAWAQKKQKFAGRVGDEAGEKRWEKIANASAYLNPKVYHTAVKERMSTSSAARDKAMFKTNLFAKLSGPLRSYQNGIDATKDEAMDAPVSQIAKENIGRLTKIEGKVTSDPMIRNWYKKVRTKAEEDPDYIRAATEADPTRRAAKRARIIREYMMNDIRTGSTPALIDLVKRAGFSPFDLGEFQQWIISYNRTNKGRRGADLEREIQALSLANPPAMPISPVGATTSSPQPTSSTQQQTKALQTMQTLLAAGQNPGVIQQAVAQDLAAGGQGGQSVASLLKGTPPETQEAIKAYVTFLQKEIFGLTTQFMAEGQDQINEETEELKKGLGFVQNGLTSSSGYTTSSLNDIIQHHLSAISKGDAGSTSISLSRATDLAKKLLGPQADILDGLSKNPDITGVSPLKRQVVAMLTQTSGAITAMRNFQISGRDLAGQNGIEQTISQIRQQQTGQLSARALAAAQMTVSSEDVGQKLAGILAAKFGNIQVSTLAGNSAEEHLEEIVHELQQLTIAITGEHIELPMDEFKKNFGQILANAANVPGKTNLVGDTVSNALNDITVRQRFAQMIGREMVESTKRAKVVGQQATNITNIINAGTGTGTNTTTRPQTTTPSTQTFKTPIPPTPPMPKPPLTT